MRWDWGRKLLTLGAYRPELDGREGQDRKTGEDHTRNSPSTPGSILHNTDPQLCFHSRFLSHICCCTWFSKCDFLPGIFMDTIRAIPSHRMIVTYHRVNACWRVAAGCDISRSPLRSLCINILQPFQERVHIYFVSCMVLPKPLSSGWSGIKRISSGNTLGHTHSHMHKHSQVPLSKETQGWCLAQTTKRGEISKIHTHTQSHAHFSVCVCVVGVSGHYSNQHFPAEWDSDCSVFLKSDDATFHFSTF